MDIDECIEKRFLDRIKPDLDIIEKELKEAEYDMEKAENAFEDEDYKWCIS